MIIVGYILLSAILTALTVMAIIAFVSWVGPYTERLWKGQPLFTRTFVPCCPPGLGCNDPDERYRACRRRTARRTASIDEFDQIEAAWSEFCQLPQRSRKRKNALKHYQEVRDNIIARALREAEEQNGMRENRVKLLEAPQVEPLRQQRTSGMGGWD